MKKLLLSLSVCFGIVSASFSQTSLFLEDFETGGASFTINTSDMSSTTNSSQNDWLINNSYTGGNGTIICLGFPFTFNVSNTLSQPGGIANGPFSSYLHIAADAATGSGITCASYLPADGTCAIAENHFAKMTNSISTVGMTSVNIDFWWLCGGSAQAYGEVYYSLDGGTTWVLEQTSMQGQGSWINSTISNAAWDNQASLMFGIRFVNSTSAAGTDPALGIDDFEIFGTSGGVSNAITTDTNIQPGSWCEGQMITTQVNFTSTGTFTAGNVYTAELSDASGSFASPTVIGTLSSIANSGMIVGVIPGSLPAGTGYRIRVVSDSPVAIGSDNGVDLMINANPTVTQAPFSDICVDAGIITLIGGSPSGGVYSGIGVQGMGTTFDPTSLQQGTTTLTYTYTDGNGCSGSAAEPITVLSLPTVTLASFADVCDTDPFFTLTGGTPSNGTYTGPGVTGGVFDPSAAGVGTHTITYSFTDGNGCTGTASSTIFVDVCGGLTNGELISFQLQPNPVVNSFEVSSEFEIESVQLLDLSGRAIRTYDILEAPFSVASIPTGVYLVQVGAAGVYTQRRIIIQ